MSVKIIVYMFALQLGLTVGQNVTGCIGDVSNECSRKYICYAGIVSKLIPKVLCDGVLIHKSWVLTSAECALLLFQNKTQGNGSVEIWMGFEGDKENDIQKRKAVKYVTYKKVLQRDLWTWEKMRYDLVLIQVEKPFTKTEYVNRCHLPRKGQYEKCQSAESATLYFEIEEVRKKRSPPFLLLVLIAVGIEYGVNKLRGRTATRSGITCCGEKNWNVKTKRNDKAVCEITDKIICQSYRKTCIAKSGTPLFCDGTLVGIESNCHDKLGFRSSEPTSYIKVENYLDFIAETTGEKKPETSTEKSSTISLHGSIRMKILVILIGNLRFAPFY